MECTGHVVEERGQCAPWSGRIEKGGGVPFSPPSEVE